MFVNLPLVTKPTTFISVWPEWVFAVQDGPTLEGVATSRIYVQSVTAQYQIAASREEVLQLLSQAQQT